MSGDAACVSPPRPGSGPSRARLAERLWPRGFAATMRPRMRWSAAAAIALQVFAACWPDDLAYEHRAVLAVSYCVFMLKTFWFHYGVALLLDALLCMAVRARFTAAALVLAGLWGVWPALVSLVPRSAGPALGEPTLTVLSANLLYGRADAASFARVVESVKPDVIVFQEYTPESAARLAGVLAARFPHRAELTRDDAFGQAVYSRLPFVGTPRAFPPGGGWTEPQFRAEIEFAGVRVAAMNVHVLPPVGLRWFAEQREATVRLAEITREEIAKTAATGGGFVIAGDFNATAESSHMALMRSAGLTDAFAEAGFGRGATWPRDTYLRFAPGVRIDHVLYGGSLVCVQAGTCEDIGSDHRPTFARFVRKTQHRGGPGL